MSQTTTEQAEQTDEPTPDAATPGSSVEQPAGSPDLTDVIAPTAEQIQAGALGEIAPDVDSVFTVTNSGPRMIIARQVNGRDYTLQPGESITVDARTALLLEVYGAVMDLAEHNTAVRVESDPVTGDETRFTGTAQGVGTRQHRHDDPRANVAGTPVSVTGDTGSVQNLRAEELGGPDIPGVPAVSNPVEAVTKGAAAKNDDATQPPVKSPRRKPAAQERAQAAAAAEAAKDTEDEADEDQGRQDDDEDEQDEGSAPDEPDDQDDQDEESEGEQPAKTPGEMSQRAARAIDQPASTGALRAVGRGAANAPRTGQQAAVTASDGDTAWVQGLDRAQLNAELERRNLTTAGSSADKRAALTAYVAQHGTQVNAQ